VLKGEDFEDVSPSALAEMLESGSLEDLARTDPSGARIAAVGGKEAPTSLVYGFRTREGGMGILQILGFTDDSKGVRIRYKMIQQTMQPSGTAPAPTSLQFRLVDDSVEKTSQPVMNVSTGQPVYLMPNVLLSGHDMASAVAEQDDQGRWNVRFTLTAEGARKFAQVTKENVGRRLAIVFDGKVVAAPSIRSAITGGTGIIALGGKNAHGEAQRIANSIAHATGAAPAQPAFGPVIERTVNHTGDNCLIDLDTGKMFSGTIPIEVTEQGTKAINEWIGQQGIDVGGGTQPEIMGLIGFDLIAFPASNEYWETKTASSLLADGQNAFKASKPGNPVFLSAKGGVPATWTFQTREGGLGILQILSFTDAPEGVKIRYKMLQQLSYKPVEMELAPTTTIILPGRYVFSQDSKYADKPVDIVADGNQLYIELEGHKAVLQKQANYYRFTTGDRVLRPDRAGIELEWFLICFDRERNLWYMGSADNSNWRQYLTKPPSERSPVPAGVRATGESLEAAATFLTAARDNDLDALGRVIDPEGVCHKKEFWPRTAKVLREMYGTDIGRLSQITDSYVEADIASFRVEHPGQRGGYLLLVAAKFPDGSWKIIEAQTGTQDRIGLRAASEHYAATYAGFLERHPLPQTPELLAKLQEEAHELGESVFAALRSGKDERAHELLDMGVSAGLFNRTMLDFSNIRLKESHTDSQAALIVSDAIPAKGSTPVTVLIGLRRRGVKWVGHFVKTGVDPSGKIEQFKQQHPLLPLDSTSPAPAGKSDDGRRVLLEKRFLDAITAKLKAVSALFSYVSVHVEPDMRIVKVNIANLRELRGVDGGNVETPIQGELNVNYAGAGVWRVSGTKDLGHVEFSVAAADLLTAEGAVSNSAPLCGVELISPVDEIRQGQYRWRIRPRGPVQIMGGWYTVEDGKVTAHAGGGRHTADTQPLELAWSTAVEGNLLLVTREETRSDETRKRNSKITGRVPLPPDAVFRTDCFPCPEALVSEARTLWRGDWVRDGRIVKSVIFAAHVATADDDKAMFRPPASGWDQPVQKPQDMRTPANTAFWECMQRDASFSSVIGFRPQQDAIAAWSRFLERGDLTKDMRVFALWRIGSLYGYNHDSVAGEKHDDERSGAALLAALAVDAQLISNETLNARTVYAVGVPSTIERVRRCVDQYRYVTTIDPAWADASAERVDDNIMLIPSPIQPWANRKSRAEKREQLVQRIEMTKQILERQMIELVESHPEVRDGLLKLLGDAASEELRNRLAEGAPH